MRRGFLQKIGFKLHDGQKAAWKSKKRFIFIIAGTQSGKTSYGPWWLYREIADRGPGDYLAVTATYDLFKLKMLPEMLRVFCEVMDWGRYMAAERVIKSHDGSSRIILRSANAPGGLESSTARAAWLDECGQDSFTLQAWEAVQRRLSLARGRVLGTTTPYNLGWLKTEVFDRWSGGHPDYEVIQFKSTMNPIFPEEEYVRAKEVMPAWRHAMFYDGEFTRPAGLIYGDYRDSYTDPSEVSGGQLVRGFSVPPAWLRTVGIDFGAVNTALIWIAEEPGSARYFVYREKLGGELTGPQHAREALEYREPVRQWLGGSPGEDAQRLDWQNAGCPVIRPYVSDVESGIDRVVGLFRQRRLFIFDACTGLRGELATYSRELDAGGMPTEKIAGKRRFHRLDALRYAASAFPESPPTAAPPDPPPSSARRLGTLRSRLASALETDEY